MQQKVHAVSISSCCGPPVKENKINPLRHFFARASMAIDAQPIPQHERDPVERHEQVIGSKLRNAVSRTLR
jgi:hypothetical protein